MLRLSCHISQFPFTCRPEESEALARRVNEHKAEYERLQKAWRAAHLQATPQLFHVTDTLDALMC